MHSGASNAKLTDSQKAASMNLIKKRAFGTSMILLLIVFGGQLIREISPQTYAISAFAGNGNTCT